MTKQVFSRPIWMRILPSIPLIGLGVMMTSWEKWEGIYIIPILFISAFLANAIWSMITPIIVISQQAIYLQMSLGKTKKISISNIKSIEVTDDEYITCLLKDGEPIKLWLKLVVPSEHEELKASCLQLNQQLD